MQTSVYVACIHQAQPSCRTCLFDLLLVGRRSTISPVCLQIYNNLHDVSVNSVHCHAYVVASRLSSNANVCACIRYSFIAWYFSEKIPFIGIHALLLMHWTRGIGHVLLWSTLIWLAALGIQQACWLGQGSGAAIPAKTRLLAGLYLLTCVAASDWRKSGITEELLKRLPPVAPVIISATMA